ncbi:MAG TPA: hypothetical protein VFR47_16775 [Anaerolineales bacterium]|nr:hypothetical protein [Anaerolineales bacterium]
MKSSLFPPSSLRRCSHHPGALSGGQAFVLHPSFALLLSHQHLLLVQVSFLFLLSSCAPVPTLSAPPAPSGSVLFEDEFDVTTTGWDRFANEGGIMDYFEGGYRILVQRPGLNFWSTPEKDYGDVRIEADVLKLAGPDENRMGLLCRYQAGNHYFFIISNDGYYAIGKFIDGQTTLLGQNEMSPNAMIQPNMINHLRADCVGDTLKFYVNFTEIATVQDGDLKSGDVGLLAGTFSQPGVDVSFDHFVVMQP